MIAAAVDSVAVVEGVAFVVVIVSLFLVSVEFVLAAC